MNLFSQQNNQDTLDLSKDEYLDLSKVAPSLRHVTLAAGWDPSESGASMDLDLAAFMLDDSGRVKNIPDDVIYFKHMKAPGIELEGDNLTGDGDDDEDDEKINMDLDMVPRHVKRIVFLCTIYDARNKRQTFGMVKNSYVRLLDGDNGEKEILKYPLKENFSTETAVTFAELINENNNWSFHAIGEGCVGDLNTLLSRYR